MSCLHPRRAQSGRSLCEGATHLALTFWSVSYPNPKTCSLNSVYSYVLTDSFFNHPFRFSFWSKRVIHYQLTKHPCSQVGSGGVRDPFIYPSLKSEKRAIKKNAAISVRGSSTLSLFLSLASPAPHLCLPLCTTRVRRISCIQSVFSPSWLLVKDWPWRASAESD